MSERSWRILLAVSLACNVFIIGAAAGAGYMWFAYDHSRQAAAQRGMRFAADNLSPEQRRAFRQKMAEARRMARPAFDEARASREELTGLLLQDTFDRAAIDTELAEIRSADMALRTRLESTVADFAGTLSPAERQIFVDGLRNRSGMLRRSPRPRK